MTTPPLSKRAKKAIATGAMLFVVAQVALEMDLFSTDPFRRRLTKDGTLPRDQLHKSDGHQTISRRNRLLYVHVPKTGGTTMEHSMLFDDAREHHLLGGHHPIADMMGNAYERRLTRMVKTAHIRHPCDRFISAFTYLTQAGNEGDKILTDKWIADQTIDEFASNYNTAGWNPNYEIRHFTPQVEFVFYTHDGINEDREHAHDKPDGTFGLDLIMCTEQWEEGLDRLGDALGKSLPSDLREKQDNHFEHQSCEELAPETREILERVYAMDYCVFDYSPLPSDKTTCVGSYTTVEMFISKYKQCQAIHRPEVAKKKPEAVWPVSYLAKLKLASATDDDDSYGADDDELAAYLEDGIKINY